MTNGKLFDPSTPYKEKIEFLADLEVRGELGSFIKANYPTYFDFRTDAPMVFVLYKELKWIHKK